MRLARGAADKHLPLAVPQVLLSGLFQLRERSGVVGYPLRFKTLRQPEGALQAVDEHPCAAACLFRSACQSINTHQSSLSRTGPWGSQRVSASSICRRAVGHSSPTVSVSPVLCR